eukprot:5792227-Heterocapsa_arctica.AAC.1
MVHPSRKDNSSSGRSSSSSSSGSSSSRLNIITETGFRGRRAEAPAASRARRPPARRASIT